MKLKVKWLALGIALVGLAGWMAFEQLSSNGFTDGIVSANGRLEAVKHVLLYRV